MAPFIRRKQENQSVATVFISTLVLLLLLPDDVRRDAPDVFYRLAAAGVTAGHRHMYIVDGMSQWIVGSMKSDCGPKVYKNTRK